MRSSAGAPEAGTEAAAAPAGPAALAVPARPAGPARTAGSGLPGRAESITAALLLVAGGLSAPGTMGGIIALGRQDGVVDAVVFAFLGLAAAVAVLARRARPGAAVVLLGLVCAAHAVVFTTLSIMALGACLVAVETAASRVARPWAWVLLAAGYVGGPLAVLAVDAAAATGPLPLEVVAQAVVLSWLFMTVALLGGLLRRRSRERREQAAERLAMLRAQQEMETRLAVAEERGRIAREVHDVVGHSLAVIAMQAEGARAVLARDPERADAALAVIGGTSRAAVDEVRALVDVLRTDDAGSRAPRAAEPRATGPAAPLTTQPAAPRATEPTGPLQGTVPGALVSGLLDLVGALRSGGARVALALELAEDADASAQVGECLVAVAREATTNALHHAAGAALHLRLTVNRDGACLEVSNSAGGVDGRPSAHREGSGLAGLRARVGALGGSLDAGPAGDGGWRVLACVPAPAAPGEDPA